MWPAQIKYRKVLDAKFDYYKKATLNTEYKYNPINTKTILITSPHCAIDEKKSDGWRDPYTDEIAKEISEDLKSKNKSVRMIEATIHRSRADQNRCQGLMDANDMINKLDEFFSLTLNTPYFHLDIHSFFIHDTPKDWGQGLNIITLFKDTENHRIAERFKDFLELHPDVPKTEIIPMKAHPVDTKDENGNALIEASAYGGNHAFLLEFPVELIDTKIYSPDNSGFKYAHNMDAQKWTAAICNALHNLNYAES